MADIDDFDLDRSTAQAWAEFQNRLSEVISMIDDTADLTIGIESGGSGPAPFVRLSSPRPGVIRCEAASNAVLGVNFQLPAELLAAMEQQGWQPPTVGSEEVAAEEVEPTPNFWIELPQVESDRLSELAVSALCDIYGVQHPVFLAPDQLAEALQPIQAPVETESSSRVVEVERTDLQATMPRDQQHLDDLVDEELAEIGHLPIRDADGDVAIRVGSTMLFLRTSSDGQEVVLFAPVVHDIAGRSRAAEVLNDLNVEARWVKFQLIKDRVFVTISVLSRPFVPAHLRQAVRILSDVADGIDDDLAAKLNGRTTFSDQDDPLTVAPWLIRATLFAGTHAGVKGRLDFVMDPRAALYLERGGGRQAQGASSCADSSAGWLRGRRAGGSAVLGESAGQPRARGARGIRS